MRIGDVKNHVLKTLDARRMYLNEEKAQCAADISVKVAYVKELNEELEGIRQTERLINTASNRGE